MLVALFSIRVIMLCRVTNVISVPVTKMKH